MASEWLMGGAALSALLPWGAPPLLRQPITTAHGQAALTESEDRER